MTGNMSCLHSPEPPMIATAGGSAGMASAPLGQASPDELLKDLAGEQAHRVVDGQRIIFEFQCVPRAPAAADALSVTGSAGGVVKRQAGAPPLCDWLAVHPEAVGGAVHAGQVGGQ